MCWSLDEISFVRSIKGKCPLHLATRVSIGEAEVRKKLAPDIITKMKTVLLLCFLAVLILCATALPVPDLSADEDSSDRARRSPCQGSCNMFRKVRFGHNINKRPHRFKLGNNYQGFYRKF